MQLQVQVLGNWANPQPGPATMFSLKMAAPLVLLILWIVPPQALAGQKRSKETCKSIYPCNANATLSNWDEKYRVIYLTHKKLKLKNLVHNDIQIFKRKKL